MIKLHIGCGVYHLEGWVNIDVRPLKSVDVVCDITKGLPFDKESVDLIFLEHVFEHFSLPEGRSLLKDWYNILRPEGRVRIAVPGLEDAIDKYLSGHWKEEPWVRLWGYGGKTNAEYLNVLFYGWEHKCIYDEELLSKCILEAGFASVQRQAYHSSEVEELKDLEQRAENESTLIIEGIK